jgi:thiol-disulfide isomerase/thioredoxin
MRMRHVRLLAPALLALTLAGCGEGEGGTAKGAGAGDTLKFSGTTLDGKAFDGTALAGKPAVLWFWAPWCGTCQGQAPQAAQLADTYKGKVNVIGVAGLDKKASMRTFVTSRKVGGFPHLADEKGAVWKKFRISQQSSFVLLDKAGKVVHSGVPTGPEELDRRVKQLAG